MKRRRKWEEQKQIKKLKLDLDQPDDQLLQRYKEAYPGVDEEKLQSQLKYQKMIKDATRGRKKKL